MNLQSDTFTYILKQYLKGKKDNIFLILMILREFIVEKYEKYNLKPEELKMLIRFLIHGIDTYSFEKTIKFKDYISLYIDISLNEYTKTKTLDDFELPDDEFFEIFISNLSQMIEDNKIKDFKLN